MQPLVDDCQRHASYNTLVAIICKFTIDITAFVEIIHINVLNEHIYMSDFSANQSDADVTEQRKKIDPISTATVLQQIFCRLQLERNGFFKQRNLRTA